MDVPIVYEYNDSNTKHICFGIYICQGSNTTAQSIECFISAEMDAVALAMAGVGVGVGLGLVNCAPGGMDVVGIAKAEWRQVGVGMWRCCCCC